MQLLIRGRSSSDTAPCYQLAHDTPTLCDFAIIDRDPVRRRLTSLPTFLSLDDDDDDDDDGVACLRTSHSKQTFNDKHAPINNTNSISIYVSLTTQGATEISHVTCIHAHSEGAPPAGDDTRSSSGADE